MPLTKVLLAEDDLIDQMAFRHLVKTAELPYECVIASSLCEAQTALTTQTFDVVLTDYDLGDGTGLELCESVKGTPVIFITGHGNEAVAVQAIKQGAYDYLIKDHERDYLTALPITLENAIKHHQTKVQVQMLSQALRSIRDSVFIEDMKGKIVFVNQACCDTYGYSDSELIGKTPAILWQDAHEYSHVRHQAGELNRVGGEWEGEHLRKDKTSFPVSLSLSPMQNDAGQCIAFIGVSRDITERKQIERELRELNASKDKFFSIISHDLKNPLSLLLGYGEVLAKNWPQLSEKEIHQFTKGIVSTANQLHQLLETLLHWASLQSGRMPFQPFMLNLKQVFSVVLMLFGNAIEQKQLQISSSVSPEVYVNADEHMLSSLLQNLISNAIKFSKPEGMIRIKAQPYQEHIELTVTDHGVGIPASQLSRLFQMDQRVTTPGTAKEKGTGLGLLLCKEFVEKHHGTITVDSEVGKGTTFRVKLPLEQPNR